jgi:hypothetical protein
MSDEPAWEGSCRLSGFLIPWKWRWYVPPKRRLIKHLHGATSQKTAFFIPFVFKARISKWLTSQLKTNLPIDRQIDLLANPMKESPSWGYTSRSTGEKNKYLLWKPHALYRNHKNILPISILWTRCCVTFLKSTRFWTATGYWPPPSIQSEVRSTLDSPDMFIRCYPNF